jgi:hypothetical protein
LIEGSVDNLDDLALVLKEFVSNLCLDAGRINTEEPGTDVLERETDHFALTTIRCRNGNGRQLLRKDGITLYSPVLGTVVYIERVTDWADWCPDSPLLVTHGRQLIPIELN